jgi:hypothetical protein
MNRGWYNKRAKLSTVHRILVAAITLDLFLSSVRVRAWSAWCTYTLAAAQNGARHSLGLLLPFRSSRPRCGMARQTVVEPVCSVTIAVVI